MEKLIVFILTTIGGSLGWAVGARVGLFTAFILSIVGTGFGLYFGRRLMRDYF